MNRVKLFLVFFTALIISQSCSENYNVDEGFGGVYLVVSSSARQIGEDITIQVITENDVLDVTQESDIYVNGELISGTTFTKDDVGVYEIKARFNIYETEPELVEFFDGFVTNFRKRVLVEDYTGTWCGWCPRISYALGLVEEQSDDAVLVAIHRAPSGTSDPYTYQGADPLEVLINSPGYPKGFLNRVTQWNFPEPDNIGQVVGLTQGLNPKLGLKLNSSHQGNSYTLDVGVKFANNFSGLKLVVYILENGLVYPQVNYTSYYSSNPIPDYVHNHTLRATLTDILGDPINDNETRVNLEYDRTFTFELPDVIENQDNIEFVAFIVDEGGNVLNVRKSAQGEVQDYEILD